MSSELSTEIRKFEVRLQEFVKAEDEAIKSLTAFIGKVKELNKLLEAQLKENKPRKIENVMDLRFEIIEALQNALNRIAKAEHEKSHLPQSYGSILATIEELTKTLLKTK
ncbi:MAG: hypothetical protein QXU46_07175 [Candidatus Bathyarchaeia archaeon]